MDFAPSVTKPAIVLFGHPVITGPVVYPPLDTIGLILYAAFFIAVTFLTMRRAVYGACILLAVAPFALYQEALGETITLSKVALLAVLLGLAAYRGAFAPLAARTPLRILTAGVFVLCATLLSFVHALHPVPVVRETLKLVEYLATFCAVVAAYRLDPDRTLVANVAAATALLVAILALAQELVGAPSGMWINGHVVPRIAGPLEGPNQLAGFLDITIPLVLALAITRPSVLYVTAAFFCVWADVLTFSRSGLIAAAIACVIVLVTLRRSTGIALSTLVAGIVCGIAVDVAWAVHVHAGAATAFRLNSASTDYAGGVGNRRELWHAAITLWKRHPLFGVGAGNFELEIPLTGLQGVKTHANSLYLQSLVEGGVAMICATLWLVYTSIAAFVRERLESPFILAAFAGSVALALHQVLDFLTFYPKIGVEWWILMALAAAEIAAHEHVRQPQRVRA